MYDGLRVTCTTRKTRTTSGGYPRPYSHCVDCGREVFDRAVPGWDV